MKKDRIQLCCPTGLTQSGVGYLTFCMRRVGSGSNGSIIKQYNMMRESTRRDVFMPFLPLLVHTLSRGVHIWIESTCMALMYSVIYDIPSA